MVSVFLGNQKLSWELKSVISLQNDQVKHFRFDGILKPRCVDLDRPSGLRVRNYCKFNYKTC